MLDVDADLPTDCDANKRCALSVAQVKAKVTLIVGGGKGWFMTGDCLENDSGRREIHALCQHEPQGSMSQDVLAGVLLGSEGVGLAPFLIRQDGSKRIAEVRRAI